MNCEIEHMKIARLINQIISRYALCNCLFSR